MDKPQLSCIFCDDIRREISGKSILIGCYGPVIYVSEFPQTLPSFSAAMTLRIPLSFDHNSEVSISIKFSDENIPDVTNSLKVSNEVIGPAPEGLGEYTEKIFMTNYIVENLTITKPCTAYAVAEFASFKAYSSKFRIIMSPISDEEQEDMTV